MSYNRDMPTGNCQKCINTFGTLGCCDTISNEWRYNCDDGMRLFDESKPKTNADRIRSSSDEKLAVICEDGCPPGAPICNSVETIEGETMKEHCQRCWLSWLKSPAEEQT